MSNLNGKNPDFFIGLTKTPVNKSTQPIRIRINRNRYNIEREKILLREERMKKIDEIFR